jgi:hypothetical protein
MKNAFRGKMLTLFRLVYKMKYPWDSFSPVNTTHNRSARPLLQPHCLSWRHHPVDQETAPFIQGRVEMVGNGPLHRMDQHCRLDHAVQVGLAWFLSLPG